MLYILFFYLLCYHFQPKWLTNTGKQHHKKNMIGLPCHSCFLQCLYLCPTFQVSSGSNKMWPLRATSTLILFVNLTGLPFTFMQVSLNSHTFWVHWNSVLMGHLECCMQMEWQGTGDKHIAYIFSALLSRCTLLSKLKFKDKIVENCEMVRAEH